MEDHQLCSFASVMDDLVQHGQAFLVLRHKDDMNLEVASDGVYLGLEKAVQLDHRNDGRRSTVSYKRVERSMANTYSWEFDGNMPPTICSYILFV